MYGQIEVSSTNPIGTDIRNNNRLREISRRIKSSGKMLIANVMRAKSSGKALNVLFSGLLLSQGEKF
jgi:hypothetical protein